MMDKDLYAVQCSSLVGRLFLDKRDSLRAFRQDAYTRFPPLFLQDTLHCRFNARTWFEESCLNLFVSEVCSVYVHLRAELNLGLNLCLPLILL